MHRALPAGETTTTVSPFVPGGVSDGQWHRVQLHYYNKVGVWGGGTGMLQPGVEGEGMGTWG